jgi:acyl carrier protein
VTDELETRVRALILVECGQALAAAGVDPAGAPDDLDLRDAGAIDSLGFLELIGALEDELGCELDFETLEPELLTVLGPLSRHVAAEARRNGVPAA